MKKRIGFFIFGLLFFASFVFFSFLVHKDIFSNFDFDTTVRVQDNISKRLDDFFSLLSLIGGFEIATLFLLLVLALGRKLKGIFVLLFYGFLHLIELFGKTFVEHLPPPFFMLRTEKLIDFPQFYVRSEFSYPSGHSARAIFISVILAFFLARSKRVPLSIKIVIFGLVFLYDFLMLTSRVYLGEHWTTDVIGGTLLGLGLALLAIVIF